MTHANDTIKQRRNIFENNVRFVEKCQADIETSLRYLCFIYLTYFDGLYINYCTVYYLLLTLTGYILTNVLYTISYLL